MALQSSGTIWLSQIQDEFGGANPIYLSEYYRGGAYVTTNNTGVPTSGAISMAQFLGTVKAVAGSKNYTAPGTYTFTVPPYQTLRVRVWGGGGATVGGTAGTRSLFNGPSSLDIIGNPGGTGVNVSEANAGTGGGAGGTYSVPSGGTGANGAKGGEIYYYDASARAKSGSGSTDPGGGSAGLATGNIGYIRGLGGGGGYADYTFKVGQLTVGGGYSVTVGKGGTSPQGASYNANDGAVYISWT